MRRVCCCVPSWEVRTVNKQVVTCVPETTYTHRCVDKGHWECREVACGPTLFDRVGGLFKHHGCGCESSCGCDSGCNTGCNECCAPRKRTERVLVACKGEERVPCTHMVRHVDALPTAADVG